MEDNVGELFILDGETQPIQALNSIDLNEKEMVYEVIRIIEGAPLFFEDHYKRMKNSLYLLGFELDIAEKDLAKAVIDITKMNQKRNCNVKVIVYMDSCVQRLLLYISRSYYPSIEEVRSGVPVGLFQWERNKPNIKIINQTYKNETSKRINEDGLFEVLLVNDEGKITEGSKSNVFFVKGQKVYTSPSEHVLIGITRQYIIEVCRKLDLELIETLVSIDSMEEIEGIFLSGTSIKVLPVSRVEKHLYSSSTHPTIIAIRDEFDRKVDEYISTFSF